MKKISSLLIGLFITTAVISQNLESEMTHALNLHDAAKTAREQVKGLEAMEKVTKKYSKEWRPNFWASYQCTQMAMLKRSSEDYPENLNEIDLLDRSDAYLQRAKELAKNEITDLLRADFHSLNALIFTFRKLYAEDEEQKKVYGEQRQQELRKAVALAPDSPVLMVLAATDLAKNYQADYEELLASLQLMKQAKKTFESYPVRAKTTHFNQEWIPYWLPTVKKRLVKLQYYKP